MTETNKSAPQTRDDDYRTLRDARTFALGPTGYAAQIIPPTHAIFRLIGDVESTPLLLQLVESDNPVARAYGLYGLFQKDRTTYDKVVLRFRNDTAPVFRLMGCFAFTFQLNQLIQDWEGSAATPPRKNFWQRLNGLFSSAK